MKKTTRLLSSLAVGLTALAATITNAQFAPLPITSGSYTQDIIVESNYAYRVSQDCVTATMDAGPALTGNTWYEQGLDLEYTNTGLPHAGTILTSVTQSDHSYQLAPSWYSNNVLFIGAYGTNYDNQLLADSGFTNGGFTLSAPAAYTALSVLTSAGNGPVVLNVFVYHADGSVDSGVTSMSSPDWFAATTAAAGYTPPANLAYVAGGRVQPVDGGFNNVPSTNQMDLWSVDLPLANTTSPVTNVSFSFVSGGRCAIFALSGSTAAGGTGPFTPIAYSPTNYNADMVVEAEPRPLPFTATMDDGTNVLSTNGTTGNTWFETRYLPSLPIAGPVPYTYLTNGVPAHGSTFTSGAYPAVYQMAPSYEAPNAVLINSNIPTATITPTTPTAAAALSFLVTGANIGAGIVTNLCIVAHQDGTKETNFLYFYDWFNNTVSPAWDASGRVEFDTGRELNNFGSEDPRLFDSVVFLQNTKSAVTNITLQYYNPTNAYAANMNAYVLAVSSSSSAAPINAAIQPFALSDLGGTVTLGPPAVYASGSIYYQWFQGSKAIAGATNATYVTPTTLASGSNLFSVTISNSVASTNLPVTVIVGPSLLNNSSFWTINDNATGFTTLPYIDTNVFQLTDNHGSEAVSGFLNTPVPVTGFTAGWTYRDVTTGGADGVAFTFQNDSRGASALGGSGGDIGNAGISPSFEIDFDIYQGNAPGNGNNGGITFRTDGAIPSPYNSDLPVELANGDPIDVLVVYSTNSGAMTVTMLDTLNGSLFTTNYAVGNLAALVGGDTAYVGFTAGTGGAQATQIISNFFYVPVGATLSAAINPPSTNTSVGEPVTFTAAPLGSPPFTYQWSYKGTAIPGATNVSFSTNAELTDAGSYSVEITSGALNATADATLNVSPSVLAILPVTNAPIFAGSSKTLTVSAYGQPPLTYQWFNGTTPILAATNASYTVPANLAPGAYTYNVAVSNGISYMEQTVTITVVPSTPFADAILALDPVSYWTLDETNGTVAYDYVGNNDGAYVGSYTLGEPGLPVGFGSNRTAVNFDGATAHVDIPVGNLNITNSITLMIMMQANSPAPTFASIFDHTDEAWRLDYDTSGFAHFADGNGAGDSDAIGSTDLGDDNWHLVTGVYNSTNRLVELYVDGEYVTGHTNETPPAGSESDVWIGGAPDYTNALATRFFSGNLADAVVFAAALDAQQIQTIYQAGDFPPAVTVPTNNIYGDLDGSVTLVAVTNGTPPLSFQWYTLNPGTGQTAPIPGQTNVELTLSNLQASQSGALYFVTVTNPYGSISTSNNPVTLNIQSGPPDITVDIAPLSLIAAVDSQQTFDVTAVGTAPLTYQWYEDDQIVPGATNSSYTFTVAQGTNTYYVTVNNSVSSVNSSIATVVSAPAGSLGFYNPTEWTVNTTGSFPTTTPSVTGQVFYGTDGNGSEGVTAWYDQLVYINGFTATFTYQDVGGSDGNNADGSAFVLQESGPTFLNGAGGSLAIGGLTPSADWEIDLYQPNGIGIIYHTDGTTGGYQNTAPVDVSGGDPITFTIQYSPGGAVTETLYDTVSKASYTTNYNIGDLTALLGSDYAYMGFSAGDGGVASVQEISNFMFISAVPVTGPTLSFTSSVHNGTGTMTLTTTEAGELYGTTNLATTNWIDLGPISGSQVVNITPSTNAEFYRIEVK